MDANTLAKAIADLRRYVERDVAAGFDPLDQIAQNAVEIVSDDYPADQLLPQAEALVRDVANEHLRAQSSWPQVTDCDRLDATFAALEQAGIVGRQDFSCCGTCGAAEILDEIRREQERGREVHGYTFYHMQDTDNAVDGGALYLSYGSILRGRKAAESVGAEIVGAMKAAGLEVVWDGAWEKRIAVYLDWKRRR